MSVGVVVTPLVHSSLLLLLCLGFDRIGFSHSIGAALWDEVGHAAIAFQCWSLVGSLGPGRSYILESATYCAIYALLPDVDHFVVARSLNPWTVVKGGYPRGILHDSLLIPLIVCIFFSYEIGQKRYKDAPPTLHGMGWLFLVAWTTHHLRDGVRHGLFLWPLPSSPPIPYYLYVISVVGLGWFVKLLIYCFKYDLKLITIDSPEDIPELPKV